jgi:hypothetical protein
LLPDLEHIYNQEVVVLDSGSLTTSSSYADDWVVFADDWNATNGGELAGGNVDKLEILFEHASKLVQSFGITIVKSFAGTVSRAEMKQGASDGVAAADAIQAVKDELTRLQSAASF